MNCSLQSLWPSQLHDHFSLLGHRREGLCIRDQQAARPFRNALLLCFLAPCEAIIVELISHLAVPYLTMDTISQLGLSSRQLLRPYSPWGLMFEAATGE